MKIRVNWLRTPTGKVPTSYDYLDSAGNPTGKQVKSDIPLPAAATAPRTPATKEWTDWRAGIRKPQTPVKAATNWQDEQAQHLRKSNVLTIRDDLGKVVGFQLNKKTYVPSQFYNWTGNVETSDAIGLQRKIRN